MTTRTAHNGYDSENLRKYEPTNPLYRKHLKWFERDLLDYVDQVRPRSMLDVGCGEGFLLRSLSEHADDGRSTLAGLDVSAGAVEHARATLGDAADVTVGTCYELPYDDHSFDLVICSQVLEHLDDPERSVRELRRVARRAVLVTVPREPVFRALAALFTLLRIGGTPGHVNFWTAGGFRDMLKRHFRTAHTSTSTVYRLGLARV